MLEAFNPQAKLRKSGKKALKQKMEIKISVRLISGLVALGEGTPERVARQTKAGTTT
jgi:hypothetical protein